MPSILFTFIFLLSVQSINVSGYRILLVCPMPARSHHNLCKAAADTLAERGHEITFISPYRSKDVKYKEIVIHELATLRDAIDIEYTAVNEFKLISIKKMFDSLYGAADVAFNNSDMKQFMNDRSEKFDALIYETFTSDYLLGFAEKFNCPAIAISPVGLMNTVAINTGNPLNIATVPNLLTDLSINMNLWERFLNMVMAVLEELMRWTVIDPLHDSIYKKHFPVESKNIPFTQLKHKIAAILINSHPSAGIARPLLPNSIEIGGFHINDPAPLPEDLKKVMDAATNGVVFFSMGSNLKSSMMSTKLKTIILNTFSKLNKTVLWKFEEDLPNQPNNVIIKSWMPQNSILAHPNTKLFISHGGLLSVTESTHFGVPLLVIPILVDQNHNAKSVTERGHGITLSFENITKSSFEWALEEAMSPRYSLEAKRIQKLFLDRPIKSQDLLVYQVEHVIRTNGAAHLSPTKLSRWSEMFLDLAAVITISLLIISIGLYCTCKRRKCTCTCTCHSRKDINKNFNAKSKKNI